MGRGADVVRRLYARLDRLGSLWRLVMRIAVGLEFVGSGLGKLENVAGLVEFFRSLGIPAPEIQAPFVASVELLCGALVLVGLLTRPAAFMLCGVMTVAIVTAAAPEHHVDATWRGLLEFLYLPEWLLLMVLGYFVLTGPGVLSLDALLSRRRDAGRSSESD